VGPGSGSLAGALAHGLHKSCADDAFGISRVPVKSDVPSVSVVRLRSKCRSRTASSPVFFSASRKEAARALCWYHLTTFR
jgi:hypothetical protein